MPTVAPAAGAAARSAATSPLADPRASPGLTPPPRWACPAGRPGPHRQTTSAASRTTTSTRSPSCSASLRTSAPVDRRPRGRHRGHRGRRPPAAAVLARREVGSHLGFGRLVLVAGVTDAAALAALAVVSVAPSVSDASPRPRRGPLPPPRRPHRHMTPVDGSRPRSPAADRRPAARRDRGDTRAEPRRPLRTEQRRAPSTRSGAWRTTAPGSPSSTPRTRSRTA